MPEKLASVESYSDLIQQLSNILVTGSLYRTFAYAGQSYHFESTVSSGRYGRLPKQIRMYCDDEKCEYATWWDVDKEEIYFSARFINQARYMCRNCGESRQYYLFIWQERKESSLFMKVGQWPALSIEPSTELSKALGPEDAKLYKKGLIDFNFGHGIGAVGYFRRVLENKINALLDLIAEAARNANVANEYVAEIEAVKKSHRVEDRIDIASKILPDHLKPGGHNPLDKLYGPLSAGLHGESDEDCLNIFFQKRDSCLNTFSRI